MNRTVEYIAFFLYTACKVSLGVRWQFLSLLYCCMNFYRWVYFSIGVVFISISEYFNFILFTPGCLLDKVYGLETGLVIGKLILFVLFYPLIFFICYRPNVTARACV